MPKTRQRNYRFDPKLIATIGLAADQEGVTETEFMRRAAKERISRHIAGGLETSKTGTVDGNGPLRDSSATERLQDKQEVAGLNPAPGAVQPESWRQGQPAYEAKVKEFMDKGDSRLIAELKTDDLGSSR